MRRFLEVANLRRLEQRTGVCRQTAHNYLSGRTRDMRSSNYNAIRRWIIDIVKEMENE